MDRWLVTTIPRNERVYAILITRMITMLLCERLEKFNCINILKENRHV